MKDAEAVSKDDQGAPGCRQNKLTPTHAPSHTSTLLLPIRGFLLPRPDYGIVFQGLAEQGFCLLSKRSTVSKHAPDNFPVLVELRHHADSDGLLDCAVSFAGVPAEEP